METFKMELERILGCAFSEKLIFPQTKGGTTEVGFLLVLYRITFGIQVFPLSSTCLDLRRLAYTGLAQLLIACNPGFPVVVDLPRLA